MRRAAIVIGAGPAGYHASLEAARMGFDVRLVDSASRPGAGSGVERIVTAGLLRAAARGRRPSRRQAEALLARQREVLAREVRDAERHLDAAGVHFEQSRASLLPSGEVSIEGRGALRADLVVIATGSRPRRPSRFPFDDRVVCDSDSMLRTGVVVPRSLVIIGAETAGCEFACLFAALGATVTLVERRRRLLRCADPEILEFLHREMQRLGVAVALEEEIEHVELAHGREPHAVATLGTGRRELCDRLLVLAGREGLAEPTEFAAAGIEVDSRGFVVVDPFFQTSRPGVYAVGDAVGPPFSASLATHQARTAVLHASGRETRSCELMITAHTLPELAVTGMIEEALKRLEAPYCVGRAEFSRLQPGAVASDASGLLKLTCGREDRRLLGVQIIGTGATELIHLGAVLVGSGGTLDQLIDQVYSHPSLSEAYRVAALDAAARAEQEGARRDEGQAPAEAAPPETRTPTPRTATGRVRLGRLAPRT